MASIRVTESVGKLVRASTATATFPASRINIGAQQYVTTSSLTLNTGVVGSGGVDASVQASKLYYVYAVLSNGAPALIASTSSTLPAGYTQARIVGYFLTNAASQIQWANATILPTQTIITTGSGTYTPPVGCTSTRVRVVGGGGGGGAGGTGGASPIGGTGGTTTFGTLVTCLGGVGGGNYASSSLGTGGVATITSPATGLAIQGGTGTGEGYFGGTTGYMGGGTGASSPFGGMGGGGAQQANGTAAVSNTGSGGGGGGGSNGSGGGTGGGSGGYIELQIASPSSSYSYSVGAGGAASSAAVSNGAGGTGGSGIIIVDESYT